MSSDSHSPDSSPPSTTKRMGTRILPTPAIKLGSEPKLRAPTDREILLATISSRADELAPLADTAGECFKAARQALQYADETRITEASRNAAAYLLLTLERLGS